MKKRISHVLCVIAAMALMSIGAVAQHAQKANKAGMRSSFLTEQMQPAVKGAVQLPSVKTGSKAMGMAQAHPAGARLTMPTATSTMDAMRQATGVVNLAGNIIYSTVQGRKGVYAMTSEGAIGDKLSTAGDVAGGYGSCVVDNKYYSLNVMSFLGINLFYLSSYDMENGFAEVATKSLADATHISQVLLYDGAKVYGTFLTATEGQYTFGTMDLATGNVTSIASVNYSMVAGGVDADGNLYGVIGAGADAYLAKINKTNGEMTKVGNGMGFTANGGPNYLSGAVIDPKTGRMFYNVCGADETGNLYEVNLTTGVATKILELPGGEEITGMYVPFTPEPGAPAAPQNLTLSFPNGALTGEVSFKTPTTTQDGNAGSGNITYKVMENGTQIATASVGYGQQVKIPVTVNQAGNYTYVVELSNAVGRSYQAKASMYIGKDVPKSPAPVTAEWAAGTMTVTWTAVTEGVNGGYVDASKVTYKVTCGDRVVKESVTGTSLTEPISENGSYKYQVVANCDGVSSEIAESNLVIVGTRALPAEFRFITPEQFEEFAVIDANQDGKTWIHDKNTKRARCAYNSNKDMDDWLIAPPVELKTGKMYKLTSIIFNNSTSYTERYEIKLGKSTTAAAMTQTVVAPTEVMTKDTIPVETTFTVTENGNYNLGVHGISDPDQFYLYVVMLRIEEIDPGLPNPVSGLTVTPDAAGALNAKIDFKAPEKSIDGNALTSLTKIEVKCGDRVVKAFENPTIGATLTCTDTGITEAGDYEYVVIAYNDKGQSSPARATAFVGFDVPAAPTEVTMTEVSNGRVKMTWKAPAADENGKPLNPSDITYEVRDASASDYPLIATLGSVLEYEFDAVEAGKCDFVQFAIFPVNSTGRGTGEVGPFMAIGTPIPTPYVEGFDPLANPLGVQTVYGSNQWSIMALNETVTSTPDGDQKFLAHKAGGLDATGIAFTAKVDLTNANSPMFTFFTFNIIGQDPEKVDINEVSVVAREANGKTWTTVMQPKTVNEICGGQPNVWGRVSVDLSAFKGKVVQVGVQAKCKLYTYTMFDKWSIMEAYDDNLSAAGITAPSSVTAGKELPVQVKVSNIGKNIANNFNVELYDINMETPIATVTVDKLESLADTVVEFKPVFAPGQAGDHTLYAKVVYAADKNADDNTTDGVIVNVKVSNEAAPTNLEAKLDEANNQYVNLTWNAPVSPTQNQRMATAITDDVESYEGFNYTGVGDWKFVDKDGKKSGGFQNMNIPGLTPGETVTGFFTFSRSAVEGNETFAAHSGDKYFAALFLYDDTQSNDWLISPELNGSAQTISFWARSYSGTYAEKIEVYTSTGSQNPDDFTLVEGSTVASVPEAWTKYEVTLPAGAKRFAIRSCATGSFMLMVDDITYIPATATPAVLVGYNVYRDNVKLNSEVIPAGTTTFKDTNTAPETAYSYYVTAVYDTGEESAASNVTSITTYVPGIGMGDVTINVVDNTIVVENATETVTVARMDGVVLFRGLNDRVVVTVDKGVYIVNIGKLTRKVMVK